MKILIAIAAATGGIIVWASADRLVLGTWQHDYFAMWMFGIGCGLAAQGRDTR